MSEDGAWFARRYPVGNPSNKLVPISREGWMVAWGFAGAMVLGGLVWTALSLLGSFVLGVIVFVVISIAAGASFIAIAVKRSDPTKTVDDYKRIAAGSVG